MGGRTESVEGRDETRTFGVEGRAIAGIAARVDSRRVIR